MQTAPSKVDEMHLSEVNDLAARVTGATAKFFSACSLKFSQSSCAELRFVRAVLFYYCLLIECGAKPVRFCANQTQFKSLFQTEPGVTLQILHALRTEIAHSLDESPHAKTLRATTRSWYRQHAMADVPADENGWDVCAQALEQMCSSLVFTLSKFLQTLDADPEMDAMKRELRHAIDDGVSRFEIESLVVTVLADLGRTDINPNAFTDRYYSQWAEFLRTKASKTDLLLGARKLIEEAVVSTPEQPPLTGQELMTLLNVPQGRMVGALLQEQKRMFQAGVRDRNKLLSALSEHLKVLSAAKS